MTQPSAPEDVVRRQLDAYNARNIDAFMAEWADDAGYFTFPDTLLARGAPAIRARHVERFQEPVLFGQLLHRMAVGSLVVDQEVVTRTFPGGLGRVDVIAIYDVRNGKIANAWFKQGEPVLIPAA